MKIVPEPIQIEQREGAPFVLNAQTLYTQEGVPSSIYDDFKSFTQKLRLSPNASNEIRILLDDRFDKEEYKLAIQEKKILIVASQGAGAFYALQTLKQLVIEYKNRIPSCVIKDKPRFGYRAFMLDVGRYFYTVEQVKRYIDLMAVHKLNYFHWHLTEDQGFRVEIKKYPELTIKGSKRSHTNFGTRPHEGFYTQDQIKEVVEYCHARYIKVIPEFDIPGHCVAAIASYPHLGCFGRELKVATHWGVKHDILCVGKESTYEFVKDVIDELCELFPDEYFHMGGDEAVKTRWKICPDCQAKIKQLGIDNEEQLQQVFMSDIHKYLAKKGKKSIMWNWDLGDNTELLDRDIIWQYCGEMTDEKIVKQINAGRSIIISTSFANYIDLPYAWANLEMTYKNPVANKHIESKATHRVLGVEAPLWTEYVPNVKKADYQTFPRLGAMAEVGWSRAEDVIYKKFLDKLPQYFEVLDMYDVHYAKEKQYNPSKARAFFQSAWFNRRQLHWQALHNLIDNLIVKIKYGKSGGNINNAKPNSANMPSKDVVEKMPSTEKEESTAENIQDNIDKQ